MQYSEAGFLSFYEVCLGSCSKIGAVVFRFGEIAKCLGICKRAATIVDNNLWSIFTEYAGDRLTGVSIESNSVKIVNRHGDSPFRGVGGMLVVKSVLQVCIRMQLRCHLSFSVRLSDYSIAL